MYIEKMPRRCFGGIQFRIVMVLITLLLIGASMFLLLESQKHHSKIDHRKAIELSDYGFQQVMENLLDQLNSGKPVSSIKPTDYNGGRYKVTVTTEQQDSTLVLRIKSEGSCGTQTVVKNEKVIVQRLINNADTTWAPVSEDR